MCGSFFPAILHLLNQSLTWKEFDATLGGKYIELPSDFNELCIQINLDGTTGDKIAYTIPKDAINPTKVDYFYTGYYRNASKYCQAIIQITTDYKVTLQDLRYNSDTNIAANKAFNVMYR